MYVQAHGHEGQLKEGDIMRVQIPLVVEFTDEQLQDYAAENGLPHNGGPLRAKDVVEDVRSYVLNAIQESVRATVTIKGR